MSAYQFIEQNKQYIQNIDGCNCTQAGAPVMRLCCRRKKLSLNPQPSFILDLIVPKYPIYSNRLGR
jgi:hypothetical protein